MAKETNTTSLDTIITLLRTALKERQRIEGDLSIVDTTIQGLQEQASAALEGTGLSLDLQEAKPKVMVNSWRDLKPGDEIRVRVDGRTCHNGEPWETRYVDLIEDLDFDGNLTIRVTQDLSDGSSWVSMAQDEWQFVARP